MNESIFGEQKKYRIFGWVKNIKKNENFTYFQLKTINNGYIDCVTNNAEVDLMIENDAKIELISYYPKQVKFIIFSSPRMQLILVINAIKISDDEIDKWFNNQLEKIK